MQKQHQMGPPDMAGFFSLAVNQARGLKQASLEFATAANTLLCFRKPTGGMACSWGETPFLDGIAAPTFPAPQPSTVNYELAIVNRIAN